KLNIYVECVKSALPTVVPPEGIVQIYSPMRQASVALVVPMPRVGIPGEKWDWPEEWMKQWMSSCLRCKVTNYGNAAIFDVRLPITATFKTIVRNADGNGFRNADETGDTVEQFITIPKIDPGKDGAYLFYLHNQGVELVELK